MMAGGTRQKNKKCGFLSFWSCFGSKREFSRFFVDGVATVRSSVRNFKTICRLIRLAVRNRWFTFYLSHWFGPRTGRISDTVRTYRTVGCFLPRHGAPSIVDVVVVVVGF
jgi:hypothetical protein